MYNRKFAKIHLDFIDKNTNPYAKCLDGPKRLKETRELNELVALVAEDISEAINEKSRKKEHREKEAADNITERVR